MGLFNVKKPVIETMPMMGKTEIPLPPKFETNKDVLDRIDRLEQAMLNNQTAIYEELLKLTKPSIPVLDEEELKYVPEEDKDKYLECKENDPAMAELLLKAYKGAKKK